MNSRKPFPAKPIRTAIAGQALAVLALTVVHGTCEAQIFGPLPPTEPLQRTPAAGATAPAGGVDASAQLVDARPAFTWRHGGLYPFFPRPAAPTHFAVCLYDPAVAPPCTQASATWLEPVGAIPSIPSPPITGGRPGEYDYTFRPSADVPAALLDRSVRWSVGACTSTTCSFSPTRDLWLSTRNVFPERLLLRESSGNILRLADRVRNRGTTDTHLFYAQLDFWNVLMTNGRTCQRDVNDAQVAVTDLVITNTGDLVAVSQLPRDMATGRRIPPAAGVQAIHRPGTWKSPSFGDPRANVAAGQLREFAFPNVYTPLPAPRAYAARAIEDVARVVREWNESDNARAECHVIQE